MDLLEAWPQTEAFKNLPNAYYLTKLRLFCCQPLCGMCAMALVHSRLDRIYFLSTPPKESIG
jgi:tRNA(Arg) A34 adenosine deaminase TadA